MLVSGAFKRTLAAGATAAAVSGCTHTVVPPAEVAQPTRVFLLDHGRTSSIVIPHDGALARYSYGEWRWYALGEHGPLRGSGALLSDTQAALGRRVFDAQPTVADVRATIDVPIQATWEIEVPATEARRLDSELSAIFRRASEVVHSAPARLRFVPHPEPYSLGHNSNHVTADWLRRMECRVDVDGPLSRWSVIERERTDPGEG